MMPAAKMLDPIIGIDLHLIQPPAGPPLLLPHPSIGIVFDPFDLIPKFGANVFVNGLPRAQAGSGGLMLPHFPIGGVFVKPPAHDMEVFMGSKTVSADDEAFSYLALPALSCQTIGLPPIPRKKKKKPKKSLDLVLPTAVVLAIPCGVFVDGPPTISLSALAFRAGLAALGMLGRRARKAQRGSKRWKALSERCHRWADNVCDKLKLGDVARNRVHRATCTVTGHPVDVATGKVFTDFNDLELPGPLPLTFERVWFSTSTYVGPFGHGWHHNYDAALYVTPAIIVHRTPDGRAVPYPPLEVGEEYFNRTERATLARGADGYVLRSSEQLNYVFAPAASSETLDSAGAELQRLRFVSNRVGQRVELRYDRAGRLEQLVDSVGRVIGLEYDRAGRIAALTAPHPEILEERCVLACYAYDELGNLVTVSDALGATFHYRYEGHLLVQEVDRAGLAFYFQYDGRDEKARCVRTWGEGGLYGRLLVYEAGRTVETDSLGHRTVYEHQGGLVTSTLDAWGGVSVTRYEQQQLVETIDALGRSTRFRYDERGNLVECLRCDGSSVKCEYDARDRPVALSDEAGRRWTWQYDERGQVVTSASPGEDLRFQYRDGLPVAVEDEHGNRTTLEFDAHANLISLCGPDGSVTQYRYDLLGFPIEFSSPGNVVWRRSFDLGGRLLRLQEPCGAVRDFAYDGEGRLLHEVSQDRDVRFEYFGMGQPAARAEAGTTVRVEYDTEERVQFIVNEYGAVHRFERGPRGEVLGEVGFDGVRRRYEYDIVGRLIRRHDASGVTSYEYDNADRLVAVTYADGSGERFEYERDGALRSASNNVTSVRFERDALGRVVVERQGKHRLEFGFDQFGRRTRLKTSFGLEQDIERGALGEVVELVVKSTVPSSRDVAERFRARMEQHPLALQHTLTLPGGVQNVWLSDTLGQPTEQHISAQGQVIAAQRFTWGASGRLHRRIDSARGAIDYQHDALGQLTAAQPAQGSPELRWPDVARNLFRSAARSDRRYGAGGQLLEAVTGTSGLAQFRYDADGNRREQRTSVEPMADAGFAATATRRYLWNAQGRLAEVTLADGSRVGFQYDPFGRRVAKFANGVVTRWLWDGDVPVHEWSESEQGEPTGAPITWIFAPDTFSPLAKLNDERVESIITDYLGTPMLMLDDRGELTWSGETDLFGSCRTTSGDPAACPFRWPGQYADAETGLHYNRHRYYDPEQGVYISRDPIGLAGGDALYAYVADPLALTDPLGLAAYGREATITLRYVPGMSKVEFYRKALRLKLLGDRGLLRRLPDGEATRRRNRTVTRDHVQSVHRRISAQYRHNRDFDRALHARVRTMQPDHVHELQLDGPDVDANLNMLGATTNYVIGTRQIRPQLRPLAPGTIIRIRIEVPPDWPPWFDFSRSVVR